MYLPSKRLHPHTLNVMRLAEAIGWGIAVAAALGYLILAFVKNWPLWPAWIAITVSILLFAVFVFIAPSIRMRIFAYEVFEEEIHIRKGFITITYITIPMTKVQHVEVKRGPIMRKYKLASVNIMTASSHQSIPGLSNENAKQLRQQIAILARIGDEYE